VKCPACGYDNLPGVDECVRCLESLMQEDVPQPRTPVEHSIMFDEISSLHSPAPETVTPDTPLSEVVRHMRETNIGYVLVLDSDRRLVGVFTERDLLCKVAGQITDLSTVPVSRLMTPNPTALSAREPIKHAVFLMAHNGFRHIPLVDEEGRPHGLATVRHVIDYIERLSAEEAA
jgi:CBS domain-containing protein